MGFMGSLFGGGGNKDGTFDSWETKQKIDDLQSQLNDKERELNAVNAELERLDLGNQTSALQSDEEKVKKYKHAVQIRDQRITELKTELENIKSRMTKELAAANQKMAFIMDEKDHQIKRAKAMGKDEGKARGAVAAEAGSTKQVDPNKLPKIAKTQAETDIILEALLSNTFMKNLARDQLQKIVDAMEKQEQAKDTKVIKEGDDGTHMYVLEKGAVSVTKGNGKAKSFVCDLTPGMLFGELAILYNCRRTASITCKTNVSLWAIERAIFQAVVKSAGQAKDEERLNLLKKVKDLSTFAESKLRKIADCLEEEIFDTGALIIQQGAAGDVFFIIRSGDVSITKNNDNGGEDPIVNLTAGDSFGEKALVKEDKRNANARAKTEVKCYTLDRKGELKYFCSSSSQ